jgi:hypothetical protein
MCGCLNKKGKKKGKKKCTFHILGSVSGAVGADTVGDHCRWSGDGGAWVRMVVVLVVVRAWDGGHWHLTGQGRDV